MKNLQNMRASHSFEVVKKLCNKDGTIKKEFLTIARSTPAKIQMTGLSTTLAFLYSKEGAHKSLYTTIEEWLKLQNLLKGDDLIKFIVESDAAQYRIITNEVQQFLVWIKRFSEGMIKKDES